MALVDKDTLRGDTSGTGGGANRIYAIISHQEKENSPYVVMGMIKVFTFDVYSLLDPGTSSYFMAPYIAVSIDIIPECFLSPSVLPHLLVSLF